MTMLKRMHGFEGKKNTEVIVTRSSQLRGVDYSGLDMLKGNYHEKS